MKKATTFYALSLAAGKVLGAPAPLHRREPFPDDSHYKWPYYCNDTNFRDKTLLQNSENSIVNAVRGYAELNYKSKNQQGEDVSVPVWISRMSRVHYDWSCTSADCDLGSNFDEACQSGGGSGPMGVTLEQIKNLYTFLKSVSKAIENQRDYLNAHMGVMFPAFGGELTDGQPWDKTIGVIAAGVSALAAMVPGAGAAAMAGGVGFGASVAQLILPQEEKEKAFKWAAGSSATFSENVQLIMKTIDTWIDLHIMKPIDDIKLYVTLEGNLFDIIQDGRFAIDPQPPLLSPTDNNILVGLAAPIINQIWRDQQIAVIVFEKQAWLDVGVDLCGNYDLKFFEEFQPDRRICDADGNLQMLLRWSGIDKNQHSYKDVVSGIAGIMDMTKYGTNRDQVIEGSIENQKAGGFDHGLSPGEAVDRLKTMGNVEELAWGKLNVWNLPVCYNTKPKGNSMFNANEELEGWMAYSALYTCGKQQDQNGKAWPYGNPWDGCEPDDPMCFDPPSFPIR